MKKGSVLTEEHKAKIGRANSISQIGLKQSKETKLKRSVKWLGSKNPRFNPDKELYRKVRKFCYQSVYRVLLRYGKDKPSKTYEMLGYDAVTLKEHIENKFTKGMSWENRALWDIDHIKPIDAFLKENITDLSIINALENLRPMWRRENAQKGSKYNISIV